MGSECERQQSTYPENTMNICPCCKTSHDTTACPPPSGEGLGAMICSACGGKPRRKVDYGDFTEYQVRCLVAEYCMSVTLGTTGWGVPFKVWVELHGIAKHDKQKRLIRLPNKEITHP